MYALNITSIGLSWIMLLVAMSPGLADQAGGDDLTPEVVDVFGYPRDFRIEGAVGIQPKEIRNALIRSPRFIMASHPAADFGKLLEVTKSDLIRGYQKSGFASPEVDVSWDCTTREVVVRVVEGPRYRLNKVRITGNSKVSRDAIKRRLAPMDDDADESSLRSDMAMESIMEEKEISEKVIAEAWNKAFPAHSQKDRLASGILSILNNPGFREKMAVWEKGKWVNFQPHYLETAELLARSVYADAGLFGPKFEIGIVPDESAEGVADLVIKVISEGRPAKIGRIHVSGNRVNSREGILKFLGFEEGVVLQGPWLKRLSRKLFDSGRFLGWRVVPKASVSDPGSIDLLIVVEEEWEAPPLDAP